MEKNKAEKEQEDFLLGGVGGWFSILKRGFEKGLTEIRHGSTDLKGAMYIGISDPGRGNGKFRGLKAGVWLFFKKQRRGQCIWDRVNKGEELGEELSQFIFAMGICCAAAGLKAEGLFRIRNFNFGIKKLEKARYFLKLFVFNIRPLKLIWLNH